MDYAAPIFSAWPASALPCCFRRFISARVGVVSTLAALAGLVQFPLGVWSDHVGRRKPFLIAMLGILALATVLLPFVAGPILLGAVVLFFSENGLCRSAADGLPESERPQRRSGAVHRLHFSGGIVKGTP